MIDRRLLAAALAAAFSASAFAAPQIEAPLTGPLFEAAKTPLPPELYCEIDGLPISRADFGAWLVRNRGDSYAHQFILGHLIRREAQARNVSASPKEIDDAIEAKIEGRTLNAYRGNRDKFIEAELTSFGRTLEQYKREHAYDSESEILIARILKSKRLTTDQDVEKEFRRLYGSSGRELWLRGILIEIDIPPITTHKPVKEIQELTQKAIEAARREGVQIVKRLQSGEVDFASAALAHSDDASSKTKGGDIGKYVTDPLEFGEPFDQVLQKARPDQILGPVRIDAGFLVAAISKEVVHDLDKERPEIREKLKNREPTLLEVQEFLLGLIKASKRVR
ncbi:MAG TPA: peptidylprolyl isomerase [Planctomycetota bacterium]|nr:peptidylprolyl isomerase [Planctomycetota bacterium]